MPRRPRKQAESRIYHVMLRGIEKKNIFIDNEDKLKIVEIILNKRKLGGFKLYAFCVMDNHLHLLLRDEMEIVSQTIKRIGTSYAYYFNKKYERVGHLFQDRFRSEVISEDSQLSTVIRYIHKNPVKAKIVNQEQDYRWSSYLFYVNDIANITDNPDEKYIYNDVDEILLTFSTNRINAKKAFIEFMDAESNDVFIDHDFSDRDMDNAKNKVIVKRALMEYGLEQSDLKSDHKRLRNLVYKLKNDEGISLRKIAEILGLDRGLILRISKNVSK